MKLAKVLAKLFQQKNIDTSKPIKVIVFCDPGIDDALMLLQLLSTKNYDIIGIVSGAGNVPREITLDNTLRICEWIGRADIKVYPGCLCPEEQTVETMLNGLAVYSDNGLGGITLPLAKIMQVQAEEGVNFAVKALEKDPVLIISTGGLTDIYQLLKQLETKPAGLNNLLGISMMAGVMNASQEANAPIAMNQQRHSEFNILFDPIASRGVFELTAKYAVPIFLAPLDMTHQLLCSETDALTLKDSNQPAAKLAYQLLHQVPPHYQTRYGQGPDGYSRQPLHDVHASACVMHPELYNSQLATISINEIGAMSINLNQAGNVYLINLPYWHRTSFFQNLFNDLQQNLNQNLNFNPKPLITTQALPIPQLIVWDLDDTLWDCLWHYRKLINATRNHHGLTPWEHNKFNGFKYVHRQHMFEHKDMFDSDKAHDALNHFYELFDQYHPEPTDAKLLDSTIAVLEKLSQHQIPMVAISNTEDRLVQKLIKHFQLDKYFKKVAGSQGVATQWQDMKPNVQLLEQLLHELDLKYIPRKSIWFIGDSLSSDMLCAKNANATGIFYCPPHRSIPQNFEVELPGSPAEKIEVQPDHIICELEHVIDLLHEVKAKNQIIELGSNYQQLGFFANKNTHNPLNQTLDETTEQTFNFKK